MAAERAVKQAETVELPLERLDRLLVLLERLAQAQERTLTQREDNARRAAKKSGPTSAEIDARYEARMRKINRSK